MAPRKNKSAGSLTKRLKATRVAATSYAKLGGTDVVEVVPPKPVQTKFVVADKQELPVVEGRKVGARHQVKLVAAYEPRSILHGLATEQGNADNRIFGEGQPEAVIVLNLADKGAADRFQPGAGFAVNFTPLD